MSQKSFLAENALKILAYLRDKGVVKMEGAYGELGMPKPTASYHVQRLEAGGFIETVSTGGVSGRIKPRRITPLGRAILGAYANQSSNRESTEAAGVSLLDDMVLYYQRIDSLSKDIIEQIDTFDSIYRELRDSDVIILNASGKSKLCASDELVRFEQIGYEVHRTLDEFTPALSRFAGKNVIILSVSGSGSDKIAVNARDSRDYVKKFELSGTGQINLTSVGFSTKEESPLKDCSDYYLVISGNNKEAAMSGGQIQNTDPGHYLGDDVENKSKMLLNIIWRRIARELSITEDMFEHNLFG